jgi:hypothetical protein
MGQKLLKTKLSLFCCVLSFAYNVYSQSLMEDMSTAITPGESKASFSEVINIISRSGKIFILSNSNQILGKGDFITLSLKSDGPVARAIVAKTEDAQAGIKIVKVYSLSRWKKLSKGTTVDIIKGDDSFLFAPKKATENTAESSTPSIDSEEDLFNEETMLNDTISEFNRSNRYIKPDNIVTAAYNQFRFNNKVTGDVMAGNQFSFTWGYQFSDNYWIEGLYGRTQVDGFPDQASASVIHNITARIKYTFKAPFYSYVMPYAGFQTISVSGPDIGTVIDGDTLRAQLETETKNDIEKTQIILGATLLKRLVPGWFFKADIGTDILSIGFGIEF